MSDARDPSTQPPLDLEAEAIRLRVLSAAADIRKLLAEDLGDYVEREIRARFLASGEYGESMDAARIKALRAATRERAQQVAAEVDRALSDDALWTESLDFLDEDAVVRSLGEVEPLWRHVRVVESTVVDLLADFGFPSNEGSWAVEYKPPVRFISHLHLPTLTERWVKASRELRAWQKMSDERRRLARERTLREKWEAAE